MLFTIISNNVYTKNKPC